MKKILILSISAAIILSGCGSSKTFSKKHHGHRNWIKVGEKVEHRDFAENQTKFSDKEDNSSSRKELSSMESESLILDGYQENSIENAASPSKAVKSIVADDQRRKPIQSENLSETVPVEVEIGEPSNLPLEAEQENRDRSISDHKEIKEKSTGELLMLALLIVAIIIVFSFVDGLLGGLLGLLLAVFIVLLILRYFGVI